MPTLSCLCGQVRIQTAKRPDFIHECDCTLCSKSGARWGYFAPSEVTVTGATQGYVREDKPGAGSEVHSCTRCAATTHFVLTAEMAARHGDVVTGVNMWLADPHDLAGIELRFPDGRTWPGQSGFDYVREPLVIGG